MMAPLLTVLMLLGAAVPVLGFSSGAIEAACAANQPTSMSTHNGFDQPFPSPFSVTFSPDTYTAGRGSVTVNLTGLCGNTFKGFLIQARRADTTQNQADAIGSFATPSGTKQLCSGAALTHTAATEKSSLSLTWTPPATSAGHLHFRVTFMQKRTAWWGNVKSEVLRDSAVPAANSTLESASNTIDSSCPTSAVPDSTSPTATVDSTRIESMSSTPGASTTAGTSATQATSDTTSAASTSGASELFPQAVQTTDCGVTKGCYSNCGEGGPCTFVVSWTPNENDVIFEILANYAPGTSGDNYMAIGFSEDAAMGSDLVSDCKYTGGSMQVTQSENIGTSSSDEIGVNSLVLISGRVANGLFYCQFRQPKLPANEKQPNLNRQYYMLFAEGRLDGTRKTYHRAKSHSSAPLNFGTISNARTVVPSQVLFKVHGCLMVIAWIFCASVGVMIARHFKTLMPGKKVAGTDIWFQIHRALMVLTMLLCIVAFIVIFVQVKRWSGNTGIAYRDAHPYLGVIVTFFVIVNPIMALFRPHPGTENRFIFNWAHWGVGTIAHILAVVTVFIGTRLGRPSIPDFVIYFVVAFTVVHIFVYICLELIKLYKGSGARSESYELQPVGSNLKKDTSSTNSTVEFLKLGLFWGYFIVTLTLTIVIVVYIGKA